MDKRNSISKILNRLENQMPLAEVGDLVETVKTFYPSYKILKEEKNIIIDGLEMTPPLAASREMKNMLKKDKSSLLKIYKDINRGDLLNIVEVFDNKIVVENLSIKEEYKKRFEIEKLELVKGNFNIVKRKSIDLLKTLNQLTGEDQ